MKIKQFSNIQNQLKMTTDLCKSAKDALAKLPDNATAAEKTKAENLVDSSCPAKSGADQESIRRFPGIETPLIKMNNLA